MLSRCSAKGLSSLNQDIVQGDTNVISEEQSDQSESASGGENQIDFTKVGTQDDAETIAIESASPFEHDRVPLSKEMQEILNS